MGGDSMTKEEAIKYLKSVYNIDKENIAFAITKEPISWDRLRYQNGIPILKPQEKKDWCFCINLETLISKDEVFRYCSCSEIKNSEGMATTIPPDETLFEWIDDGIEIAQDEMSSFGNETFLYYHVTSRSNLNSILKGGLVALKGNHSNLVHEEQENVYLCGKKDVPHWICELGLIEDYVILEVRLPKKLKPLRYSNYTEYLIDSVEPELIREVQLDLDFTEAVSAISQRLMEELSHYCFVSLMYRLSFDDDDEADINEAIGCLHSLAEGIEQVAFHTIDWSSVDLSCFLDPLRIIDEDGKYPFTDVVMIDTPFSKREEELRIWQLLERYPKNILAEDTEIVLSALKQLPDEVLFAGTGGWD